MSDETVIEKQAKEKPGVVTPDRVVIALLVAATIAMTAGVFFVAGLGFSLIALSAILFLFGAIIMRGLVTNG